MVLLWLNDLSSELPDFLTSFNYSTLSHKSWLEIIHNKFFFNLLIFFKFMRNHFENLFQSIISVEIDFHIKNSLRVVLKYNVDLEIFATFFNRNVQRYHVKRITCNWLIITVRTADFLKVLTIKKIKYFAFISL